MVLAPELSAESTGKISHDSNETLLRLPMSDVDQVNLSVSTGRIAPQTRTEACGALPMPQEIDVEFIVPAEIQLSVADHRMRPTWAISWRQIKCADLIQLLGLGLNQPHLSFFAKAVQHSIGVDLPSNHPGVAVEKCRAKNGFTNLSTHIFRKRAATWDQRFMTEYPSPSGAGSWRGSRGRGLACRRHTSRSRRSRHGRCPASRPLPLARN